MITLKLLNSATLVCDITRLVSLQQSCFQPPWSIALIEQQLAGKRGISIALLDNGFLVGFVFYQLLFDEAEILQIAIDPSYQQRGLANELLVKSFAQLQQQGVNRILLEVRASNLGAIKLYQSLHFLLDGRRKNYYPSSIANVKEDALLYSLMLAPND